MIRLPILSGPAPNSTRCFHYDPQSDVVSAGTALADAAWTAVFSLQRVVFFFFLAVERRFCQSFIVAFCLSQSWLPKYRISSWGGAAAFCHLFFHHSLQLFLTKLGSPSKYFKYPEWMMYLGHSVMLVSCCSDFNALMAQLHLKKQKWNSLHTSFLPSCLDFNKNFLAYSNILSLRLSGTLNVMPWLLRFMPLRHTLIFRIYRSIQYDTCLIN